MSGIVGACNPFDLQTWYRLDCRRLVDDDRLMTREDLARDFVLARAATSKAQQDVKLAERNEKIAKSAMERLSNALDSALAQDQGAATPASIAAGVEFADGVRRWQEAKAAAVSATDALDASVKDDTRLLVALADSGRSG